MFMFPRMISIPAPLRWLGSSKGLSESSKSCVAFFSRPYDDVNSCGFLAPFPRQNVFQCRALAFLPGERSAAWWWPQYGLVWLGAHRNRRAKCSPARRWARPRPAPASPWGVGKANGCGVVSVSRCLLVVARAQGCREVVSAQHHGKMFFFFVSVKKQ